MTIAHVDLRIPGGTLVLGKLPRVAGTLSSASSDSAKFSTGFPSDAVEMRLDEIGEAQDWLEQGRGIEARGFPVILTIRSNSEGGKWNGSEAARLKLYETALDNLSCVDVELRSEIATSVSKRASRLGKTCIVSYHDFERTPPVAELQTILSGTQNFASVIKVATMIRGEEDAATLRELLGERWQVPLCVMGMGPLGAQTRVSLAIAGSCLTYGYLDKPAAPGQPSAADLVARLRAQLPEYDEDCLQRRRTRERLESSRLASIKS